MAKHCIFPQKRIKQQFIEINNMNWYKRATRNVRIPIETQNDIIEITNEVINYVSAQRQDNFVIGQLSIPNPYTKNL